MNTVPYNVVEAVLRIVFSNTEPYPAERTMWAKRVSGNEFSFYVYYNGRWEDVSGTLTIPEMSVYLSSFINDAGYLTENDISGKQDTLVSGENIKTINGQSIIGGGNIQIDTDDSVFIVELDGNIIGNFLNDSSDNSGNVPEGTYQSIQNAIAEGKLPIVVFDFALGGVFTAFFPNAAFTDFYVFSNTVTNTNFNLYIANDDSYTLESFELAMDDHQHGYLSRDGKISGDHNVSNGDCIVVGAGNNRNIASSSIVFDGSTTTHALSKKGTWEEFYQKSQNGIPKSDLDSSVQTSLNKADTSYQKPSTGIPKTDLASSVQTSLGKADTALQEHQSLDGYAQIGGYYEGMGVGSANNLRGSNVVDGSFVYRPTAGNTDIQSGVASIERIQGKSLSWNQLCYGYENTTNVVEKDNSVITEDKYVVVSTQTTTSRCLFISHNITQNKSVPANHKALVRLTFKSNFTNKPYLRLTDGSNSYVGTVSSYVYTAGAWNTCSLIINGFTPKRESGVIVSDNSYVGGEYISLPLGQGFQVFDLTLIYGAGNEPSTPEQFEADYFNWFGKPLTYEPYDAGSIRVVNMQGIKTIGFNQWDEEWEVGNINDNGVLTASNSYCRSKNFIPCFQNTTYNLYIISDINGANARAYYYDADKNFLQMTSWMSKSSTFKTPNNCRYMKFKIYNATYGTAYKNDICINISNAQKNGTYEPYWEEIKGIDVTALQGKLNGEGQSVTIFPDGMKGVGNVKDEIYVENGVTKAIKRIGRVDLGELSWIYYGVDSNNPFGRFCSQDIKNLVKIPSNDNGNILCSLYRTASRNIDKSTTLQPYTESGNLNISDSSYTDAATFKTAMSGVMLDYELATPQVYVLDTNLLPLDYKVDGNGTEQILNTDLAPTLSIRAGIDAVGTLHDLPKNYISEESVDNLLAQLSAAMNGTWTKTWNNSTNRYDFSFTPASNTNEVVVNS